MGEPLAGARLEEAMAALLFDAGARARLRAGDGDPLFATLDFEELEEAARGVRRMVLDRVHRGAGGLADWYPRTLAAWRAAHPDDDALDFLATRFCASVHCAAWRELDTGAPGISLEEAFHRFFVEEGVGDAAVREEELVGAVVRVLCVTPGARFLWPASLRRAPGGCFAITREGVLHAALDGRYLRGPVTPLVAAALLDEASDAPAEARERVQGELRRMRLLPPSA